MSELRTRHGPDRQTRFAWGLLVVAATLALGILQIDDPGRTLNQLFRPTAKGIVSEAQGVVASAAPTPQAYGQPVVHPTVTARPRTSSKRAVAPAIAWSTGEGEGQGKTRESPACVIARMDVLIEPSAENLSQQRLACGHH